MAGILEQIGLWVEQIISSLGYVGIALLMLVENLLPPIPSEVIMPFAGSLAAKGEMNIVGVFVAGTAGALAGAVFIYYIGVWLTGGRVRNWFKNYGHYLLLSVEDYDNARSAFARHGKIMVLIGRLMPGIRSLISLPAGLNRMNLPAFILYTALGTSFWNILLLGGGFLLGENWQQVIQFVNTYETAVWILLGAALVYFILKRFRTGRHKKHQTPI